MNKHILIEPVKYESFILSGNEILEEVGIVISVPEKLYESGTLLEPVIENDIPEVGDKVYFDSWLAAKYPTGDGDNFFWLVKWDDIRAIEKHV